MTSPFIEMQKAVDIVNSSLHPTNKIAATVFGDGFSVSRTNYWPDSILRAFGHDTDIGNASGTLHAEIACILAAPFTASASICITDPLCPNCAKNIAEAGIKTLYIDHKGFEKDFAARRYGDFENMSMKICKRAGISVYKLHRKEEKLVPILEVPEDYIPPDDAPVILTPLDHIDEAALTATIADLKDEMGNIPFAVSAGTDRQGNLFSLCARSCSATDPSATPPVQTEIGEQAGKYSFIHQPVNRILMNAARLGIVLDHDYLYASTLPASRELVNLVGAGFTSLYLGKNHRADDPDAEAAIKQLAAHNVLKIL